jgi:hypothetical protein
MGHLSRTQITVLALWVAGLFSQNLRTFEAQGISKDFGERKAISGNDCENGIGTERQTRKKRVDWEVSQSFVPLLEWILALWSPNEQKLVLAMDATS